MPWQLRRAYSITTGGDIKVIDHPPGASAQDISTAYQNIARDPKRTRIDALLEIYEMEDGGLWPRGGPNGDHQSAVHSYRVLWELYDDDLNGMLPPPRAF